MKRRRRRRRLTMLLPAVAALAFGGHSFAAAVADEARSQLRREDDGGVAAASASNIIHLDAVNNDEREKYESRRHRRYRRRRLQKDRQAPPSNDDCAAAIGIRSLPFQYNGSTAGATADFDGPSCGAFRYANGVWFSYRPSQNQVLTAEGDGAGVRIYSGSCGNLACVAQYDASHDFVAMADVEYYFLVSRVSFSQGAAYEFALSDEGATRPPMAAPAPTPRPTPRPTVPPAATRPPIEDPDPTPPPVATRPPNMFDTPRPTARPSLRPTPRPTAAMETKAPTPRPSSGRPTPRPTVGQTGRPSQRPTRRPIATPAPTDDDPSDDGCAPPTWHEVEAALIDYAAATTQGGGTKASKLFHSKTGKLFKTSCKSAKSKSGVKGKAGKGSKSSKSSKGVSGKASWKGGWSGGSSDGYYLSRLERTQTLSDEGRIRTTGDGHVMGARTSVTRAMGAVAAVGLLIFVGAKFGAVEYGRRQRG